MGSQRVKHNWATNSFTLSESSDRALFSCQRKSYRVPEGIEVSSKWKIKFPSIVLWEGKIANINTREGICLCQIQAGTNGIQVAVFRSEFDTIYLPGSPDHQAHILLTHGWGPVTRGNRLRNYIDDWISRHDFKIGQQGKMATSEWWNYGWFLKFSKYIYIYIYGKVSNVSILCNSK